MTTKHRAPTKELRKEGEPVTNYEWKIAFAASEADFLEAIRCGDTKLAWDLLSDAAEAVLACGKMGGRPRAKMVKPTEHKAVTSKAKEVLGVSGEQLRTLRRRLEEVRCACC